MQRVDKDRLERFRALLETKGERAALAYLISLSPFRYLSVIYFKSGRGHPVHHYDREYPEAAEAEELDQQATYCSIALAERQTLDIADSHLQERLKLHPARELIRAYFGIPLFASDGSSHAVLCHYDHVPRDTSILDRELLRHAAEEFQRRLANYGAERVPSTATTVYTENVGSSTFHVLKHTKAEWAQPRYSVERTRTRSDGTLTARISYGESIAFGQGGFSSFEDAQEFGREWCKPT